MDTIRAKQSDNKDTAKKLAHTPHAGRRTLMLSLIKTIKEKDGHSTIEILPPLTEPEYGQIHYTQLYINPTFSNYELMNVFETYFAVKYTFMRVTELPPIRVFKADGQLWSVDNRRLWVMKHANKFYCEGPFTKEQDSRYFNEVVIKRRSLRGGSGKHVQFQNDPSHVCCIIAFNQGNLDAHLAEAHLKVSLESIRYLAKSTYFDNLVINEECLRNRIRERCVRLKRIMNHFYMPPCEKLQKLFSTFDGSVS